MRRTDEEVNQACEFLRITLVMSGDNKVLAAQRDVLRWVLGEDGTKFGELIRRSQATPMPGMGEDIASALHNLGAGTRIKAEEIARQVIGEMPTADFETAIRRALAIARPPAPVACRR